MSKQDLAKEVKLIRQQLYTLKNKYDEREDKLAEFMLILKPFFEVLSPSIHKQIQELIDKDKR